jgi:hypothetical protein
VGAKAILVGVMALCGCLASERIEPSSIDIVTASEDWPEGSCLRCLIRSKERPAVLFDGDLCPPPVFAARKHGVVEDGELRPSSRSQAALASIRDRVRLARKGACPCSGAPPARVEAFTVCAFAPVGGEYEFDTLTL